MDLNGYNVDSSADPNITQNVSDLGHQTNAGIAGQYNSGISQARGLLNPGGNPNAGLAYGDKATSDAIRSRFSMPYQRQENELKLDNMRNAETDHIRNLQVATAAAGEEVAQNRQKAILKWKVEQQNKRARGAVLGTVLGITGGVAGGYLGAGTGVGAVGGASAGFALGSGAGEAIGGDL